MTVDERRKCEGLLSAARSEHQTAGLLRQLDGPAEVGGYAGPNLGAKFVASKGYRQIKSAGDRGQTWTSGPVNLGYFTKGTLLEGTGASPGTGGPLVQPHYTGGVVASNFPQLGLADYFGQATTTSNQVRYSVEGTALSGAAGVAEGGLKPESTLALSEVSEPVKKLATTLPISDEMLEDSDAVGTYINERLTTFLKLEEERQLLRGGGTNELVGLFSRGISTLGLGTAIANHVQIFRAAAGIRGSAFLDPDTVVLHPTNWVTSRLATDSTGQYLGGGPWLGAYGQQSQVGAGYFSSAPLWGMRVFVSPYVGAGTALVGNFGQSARIYRRAGISVEATNSHSDFFVKDLSMLRAEERLALACFRPAAFCSVTTLT